MKMDFSNVSLEPDLERVVENYGATERRDLARKLYRWSKQLWVSAQMLDPQPHRRRRRKKLF